MFAGDEQLSVAVADAPLHTILGGVLSAIKIFCTQVAV